MGQQDRDTHQEVDHASLKFERRVIKVQRLGSNKKKLFGKVLVFNPLKCDGKHLITLTFIVLKSSNQISLQSREQKGTRIKIFMDWTKNNKRKIALPP